MRAIARAEPRHHPSGYQPFPIPRGIEVEECSQLGVCVTGTPETQGDTKAARGAESLQISSAPCRFHQAESGLMVSIPRRSRNRDFAWMPSVEASAQAPATQGPANEAPAIARGRTAPTVVLTGRWVDLTHPFDPTTIYWPTEEGFQLTVEKFGMTEKGYFYSSKRFASGRTRGHASRCADPFFRGRKNGGSIVARPLCRPGRGDRCRRCLARATPTTRWG